MVIIQTNWLFLVITDYKACNYTYDITREMMMMNCAIHITKLIDFHPDLN